MNISVLVDKVIYLLCYVVFISVQNYNKNNID